MAKSTKKTKSANANDNQVTEPPKAVTKPSPEAVKQKSGLKTYRIRLLDSDQPPLEMTLKVFAVLLLLFVEKCPWWGAV